MNCWMLQETTFSAQSAVSHVLQHVGNDKTSRKRRFPSAAWFQSGSPGRRRHPSSLIFPCFPQRTGVQVSFVHGFITLTLVFCSSLEKSTLYRGKPERLVHKTWRWRRKSCSSRACTPLERTQIAPPSHDMTLTAHSKRLLSTHLPGSVQEIAYEGSCSCSLRQRTKAS